MSSLKVAIAGLRHGHIFSIIEECNKLAGVELVAVCEEDAATRDAYAGSAAVTVTHDSYEKMLAEVPCDIVAIGDYYGKRGALAIRALTLGKHVVADKPLCTSLDELDRIVELSSENGLCVSSMFGLRGNPQLLTMQKMLADHVIGPVRTICVTGQHPLMLGKRPGWYFEAGKHGGTLNDIGIHAADLIPWLTGQQITKVVAARCWNAKAPQTPWFKDCAQALLQLDNGGGVIADFSYLAPDACGFGVRQYWRVTVHGDNGVMEYQKSDDKVYLATGSDLTPQEVASTFNPLPETFLQQLINEIRNDLKPGQLTTQYVLATSRKALLIQKCADMNFYDFEI